MDDDDYIYTNLDANKVLDAFGKYGKYQMRTYLLLNSVHLLYAINMMIMPFVTEEPAYKCEFTVSGIEQVGVLSLLTMFFQSYTKIDECHYINRLNQSFECRDIPGAFVNYENSSHSLAAEFDLICGRKNSVQHGSSLFLLGGMLVAPLIMQLSDLYGRRLTYVIPVYASLVANLFCAFAPNYTIFLVFRFIAGIAATSYATNAMTLSLESVSTEFRSLIPIAFNSFWIIGYLLAGVFKLYINEWRYLYIAATLPSLLCLPYYWLIPESLHWLLNVKKYDEVKKYIKTCERYNGEKIDLHACQTLESSEKKEEVKRTFCDIFKSPALSINMFINGYIFIVLSFVYWALSLFSTELAEDKMTGYFLSGLSEIPGAVLSNLMIHFFSRKFVSCSALLVQTICMIFILLSPARSMWLILFPLITKCFSVVMWSNHPLLVSESTPTSVRNSFMGLVGFLRDFGGVLAPYLAILSNMNPSYPTILIGFTSFTAALLIFTLAETKDKELPEDIPDFDPGPIVGKCFREKGDEKEPSKSMLNGKV